MVVLFQYTHWRFRK